MDGRDRVGHPKGRSARWSEKLLQRCCAVQDSNTDCSSRCYLVRFFVDMAIQTDTLLGMFSDLKRELFRLRIRRSPRHPSPAVPPVFRRAVLIYLLAFWGGGGEGVQARCGFWHFP